MFFSNPKVSDALVCFSKPSPMHYRQSPVAMDEDDRLKVDRLDTHSLNDLQ